MGAFEYVAVDASGRERKGVIEGDTPRHVRQLLREQGLLPVVVDEVVEQRETTGQRPRSLCASSAG
jgi:general secretion pathway protein F